jgi:O-antigen ligase
LLLIIFLPQAGITSGIFLAGTWRGIFTHKNYFGSIMALDNGLFLLALTHRFPHARAVLINAFFYFLTIFLVVMSQSATGVITLICLNSLTGAYYFWLRFKSKLQPHHYKMLAAASAVMAGLIFLNLNFLLSMVGRNSTFTGRLPLWEYLFREVISKRPWLGYGLETVWYERTFQVAAGNAAKWGMIVINSHNGYIDLLVYLGSIGLTLFLMLVVQSIVRVSRYVLSDLEPQAPKFVALLILVYVLIANTTISYIVEFESFHWLLFVLALSMATFALHKPSTPTISSGSVTS